MDVVRFSAAVCGEERCVMTLKTAVWQTKNRSEFIGLKIVHKWNLHLEIFSRPQAIENSRQYLLLRTDI